MKKILITDKVHDRLREGLIEMGCEVDYFPKMSYQDVRSEVGRYDGLIINSKVICDRAFLDQVTHLDFIGRLGSGLDIIDLPYAKKVGIEIISSPEGNANAVGEHTLGMLIMLLQKLYLANYTVRESKWIREKHRGTELSGKKIGIIGYGHTGPAFAQRLRGFDVEILVYDKYKKIEDDSVSVVSLASLLKESDVVSIHLPLTDETSELVDQRFLSAMKKGSVIINTSRGNIVQSISVLEALQSGHLSGACLDVLENERPETWTDHEREIYTALLQRDDVVATPHVAGWTHRSLRLIAEVLLEKISIYFD